MSGPSRGEALEAVVRDPRSHGGADATNWRYEGRTAGSVSNAPKRTKCGPSSAMRAQRCAPQAEQKHFAEPSGGCQHRICSAPDSTRSDRAGTNAEIDAPVPVRRWQRVQWQYPASVSGSVTSKRTEPQRQPPASGVDATPAA